MAWVSPKFRALHPGAAGWIDAAPSPWIVMTDKVQFVESRHCLTWAGHWNQQNLTHDTFKLFSWVGFAFSRELNPPNNSKFVVRQIHHVNDIISTWPGTGKEIQDSGLHSYGLRHHRRAATRSRTLVIGSAIMQWSNLLSVSPFN